MFYDFGENCCISDNVEIGLQYSENCQKTVIGNNAVIRSFTIIYADVVIGDNFITGHHVLIREKTRMGNRIVIGSSSVIDGNVEIGNEVKIESRVYIPTHTVIGNNVFIGPCAVLTNDTYPQRLRDQYKPEGPIIADGVTIGAGSVILPGKEIGTGSFIAAGTVVTKDIPEWSMVKGNPGRISPIPEKLRELNRAIKW
jgi:acetyltransferase-like isoleucine patch superfamily enzyme